METKPLLLIAEDDPDDQFMIQEAIRVSCPSEIETQFVWDGMELMSFLVERSNGDLPPTLIVLDLNMPRKDGRQALQEIRSNSQLAGIPVAILTTSNTEEDIHYCKGFGIVEYYRKPNSMTELQEILRRLCTEILN